MTFDELLNLVKLYECLTFLISSGDFNSIYLKVIRSINVYEIFVAMPRKRVSSMKGHYHSLPPFSSSCSRSPCSKLTCLTGVSGAGDRWARLLLAGGGAGALEGKVVVGLPRAAPGHARPLGTAAGVAEAGLGMSGRPRSGRWELARDSRGQKSDT
jgi:hypothetical protein